MTLSPQIRTWILHRYAERGGDGARVGPCHLAHLRRLPPRRNALDLNETQRTPRGHRQDMHKTFAGLSYDVTQHLVPIWTNPSSVCSQNPTNIGKTLIGHLKDTEQHMASSGLFKHLQDTHRTLRGHNITYDGTKIIQDLV